MDLPCDLGLAVASASLPPSAEAELLSLPAAPPPSLPPRAVVRSEQIMDMRPQGSV